MIIVIIMVVIIMVRVIGIGIILVTDVIKRITVIIVAAIVVVTIIGSLRDPPKGYVGNTRGLWGPYGSYGRLLFVYPELY